MCKTNNNYVAKCLQFIISSILVPVSGHVTVTRDPIAGPGNVPVTVSTTVLVSLTNTVPVPLTITVSVYSCSWYCSCY